MIIRSESMSFPKTQSDKPDLEDSPGMKKDATEDKQEAGMDTDSPERDESSAARTTSTPTIQDDDEIILEVC